MDKQKKIELGEVEKVAQLASLPLTQEQEQDLADKFSATIDYVSQIQQLDTASALETSQVTGLFNVLREDRVEPDRMFPQQQALQNASRQHKGFFMIKAIFEENDN